MKLKVNFDKTNKYLTVHYYPESQEVVINGWNIDPTENKKIDYKIGETIEL